ncbi:hypothetical protein Ct61P_15483 [Colletotrichum tofieldiae]|nr:hypothetical protein Ct61P_15483 [Colletotrichum tofieldiae]
MAYSLGGHYANERRRTVSPDKAHDGGFEAAVALTRCVAQGRHGASACLCASGQKHTGENDENFHLSPRPTNVFLGVCGFNADIDPEFLLVKLYMEYDPNDGLLSFCALGAPNITLAACSNIENGTIRGNRYPDISWGRLCFETSRPVVAEIVYTHSTKFAKLQKRCEGFLKGMRGLCQVHTVIPSKIYNPAAPSDFKAVMCYVDI